MRKASGHLRRQRHFRIRPAEVKAVTVYCLRIDDYVIAMSTEIYDRYAMIARQLLPPTISGVRCRCDAQALVIVTGLTKSLNRLTAERLLILR